ncbi:Nif3-like dinuclear metal center hexameric protein [Aminipila luticellarii]|uniref:GTP cyclohydrolase 1 type 2 homolog n=1 Tax=Aminipila luticellarii TaxID=2507160 RepID=A0A410PVG1_9FIRM|nr:Nif3-like dinuclear metal center hexameric protein [Aminipila luticellarii]QAT42898.1 Nif3-like dinuclear metal center hexameric protein [Aminipila luticellarii]
MAISKLELIHALKKIAPAELAEPWDNSGMQIDLAQDEVKKILVSLEITKEVVQEAVTLGADLIVTHHPLYFSPLKRIDYKNIIGNYTVELIKNGISVYSAHTNFDKADRGNNFYLAKLLGLENLNSFEPFGKEFIGLFGDVSEKKPLKELVKEVECRLNLSPKELQVVGEPDQEISRIGLCTGAGAEMLDIASRTGCELFITGDVKYHDAMRAKETGMNVIDAGHYGTEKIFVRNMAEQLKELLKGQAEIFESQVNINPFDFL